MTTIDSQYVAQYQASENILKDKIILVTGAGSGIGKSAALHFARHGATVILVGRTLAKLEAVYDEIEDNNFPMPAIFPINLESALEQDYQALYDAIKDEFGQLDGLLHNAGELGPRTPLTHYAPEQWNKVMQVNVTAPFILTKTLIPLLDNESGGSVLFTGSSVGKKGKAFWGAYAASKAATENLMQVFSDELEGTSNVRVNSINPGAIRTPMRASAFPAEDPMMVVTPDEIMNRYLFLIGPDSHGITGQQFDAQP